MLFPHATTRPLKAMEAYRVAVMGLHRKRKIKDLSEDPAVLGPPVVRVEGCGDCLLVNSSLPRGDGISPDDFRTFCRSVEHTLHWRRPGGETVITPIFDPSKPKRITHLLPGELYCLRVNLSHSSAPTLASDWQCARTSPALPPGGQYVRSLVGWSMGTVCVGVLVMVLFAALCYTGAICRRKPQLPQSLVALVRGFFLSPELVDADAVFVSSECVTLAQKGHTHPPRTHTPSDGADSEEEEDDEGRNYGYMDRAEPASGPDAAAATQHHGSCSPPEDREPLQGPDAAAATQHHGSCSPPEDREPLQGQPEVRGHGREPPPSPDNMLPLQRREESDEEKRDGEREEGNNRQEKERETKRDGEREGDAHGDVNLFSVRLGGLKETDQEDKKEREEKEEKKEEEQEQEEETTELATEDWPLLNVGKTHTHTDTDTHIRTEKHPDTLPFTHTATQTQTHRHTHTHAPTQTHTSQQTPAQPLDTDWVLLKQVKLNEELVTGSHTQPHTHTHTQATETVSDWPDGNAQVTQTVSDWSDGDSDSDSRPSGYLATHAVSIHIHTTDEEEEDTDEEDCSGYMTR